MSINLLSLMENNKSSIRKFKLRCNINTSMYLSFAVIPLALLIFYGIEDNLADFFANAIYPDDYRTVYDNKVYHLGIMVSHWAIIVILSILGILLSWIGHEGLKLVTNSITRPKITIDDEV